MLAAPVMAHFLYFWCFNWASIGPKPIDKHTLHFGYLSATQFCNPRSDPLKFHCLDLSRLKDEDNKIESLHRVIEKSCNKSHSLQGTFSWDSSFQQDSQKSQTTLPFRSHWPLDTWPYPAAKDSRKCDILAGCPAIPSKIRAMLLRRKEKNGHRDKELALLFQSIPFIYKYSQALFLFIENTHLLWGSNRSSKKWKSRIEYVFRLDFEGNKNPIIIKDGALVDFVTYSERGTYLITHTSPWEWVAIARNHYGDHMKSMSPVGLAYCFKVLWRT